MKIRRLPEGLVNRIAAGEVVERPASVVKELIENSIDSGARRIEIFIEEGGQALIRVSDDGSGINREELPLAIERHATSKIQNYTTLSEIDTLGFRGEALPSIGSIARMAIISRVKNSQQAWRINVNGGDVLPIEPAARAVGTDVLVRDIFFATPARLKFMKTPKTENGHITDVVVRLSMARPDIDFKLTLNGRLLFNLSSELSVDEGRLTRLSRVVGNDFRKNNLVLKSEREGIKLNGYIGFPSYNRSTSQHQYLFVNKRPVHDKMLNGALRGAYRDLIPSGRHPVCALFLEVPSHLLDVNVHPTKAEVRFSNIGTIRGLVVGSIRHSLSAAGHRTAMAGGVGVFGSLGKNNEGEKTNTVINKTSKISSKDLRTQSELINTDPIARSSDNPEVRTNDLDGFHEQEEKDYPLGAARAQVHATYIVSQTIDGIVIVDQHAAHERIVYERMKKELEEGTVKSQILLIPEVVEVGSEAANFIDNRVKELGALGLIIEPFGPGTVLVREVPAILGEGNIKGLVQDIVDNFSYLGARDTLIERLYEICASMACHSSVRAGRLLNNHEMNQLLRQMEATPNSGQCNHGRPTYIELALGDIEKLFGRR
ncbi:MAG: DNA mismatch repair endonuclease MutL [Alphaproteobacteria bacterium]|nr:DNA mismatch repair endonuclease MutL [Alphaproteobacteria bacterium]|tara:strand:- start:708 stop:2510 length:1803 start_codon:yes stop_codon:yes gene_type:complete